MVSALVGFLEDSLVITAVELNLLEFALQCCWLDKFLMAKITARHGLLIAARPNAVNALAMVLGAER